MHRNSELQDKFLDYLVKNNLPVNVFLVNGIKLVGMIQSFSSEMIVLSNHNNSGTQVVNKHAIASIMACEKK